MPATKSQMIRTSPLDLVNVAAAVVARGRLASPALSAALLRRLSALPGKEGSLLSAPVIEAAQVWEQADESLGDLAGGLLHPRLVDALDGAQNERMPRDRYPYTHQLAAWKAARDDDEGCRRVQGQDHGAQSALADRLHLSKSHRLGLVLLVDRPRRLLALHHRLEAVPNHEGRDLETQIEAFVAGYNHLRYHESIAQPDARRRLLRARPDHSDRKGKDQTTDNRQPPLAASSASRITLQTRRAWAKGAGESAGSPARRQGASVGAGISPAAAIAPSNALQRLR
jgi:hypothetical protein